METSADRASIELLDDDGWGLRGEETGCVPRHVHASLVILGVPANEAQQIVDEVFARLEALTGE